MKCKAILTILLLILLCGCSPYSVESLFAPPAVPEEYAQLNAALGEVRATGAEYVYPTAGTNRQAVQMFDLDTDGEDECVVFFRNPAEKDEVQIYLYECTDGKYWLYASIEGLSSAVERVEYADVLGRGNYELIVGWHGGKKTLAVYEMTEETFGLQYEMPYQYFVVCDLNGDGVSDLNLIDGPDPSAPARLVTHAVQNGRIAPQSQVTLSAPVSSIERIGFGKTGGMQAVFVTSRQAEGYVTDVLGGHGHALKNLSAGAPLYCKYPVFFTDLDGDGEIEVPKSEQDPMTADGALWELVWCGFGEDGMLREEACTYHCGDQSWYLCLPISWKGKVRTAYDNSNALIAKAVFYTDTYEPLFTFAAISGEKRMKLMEQEGMQQVSEQDQTVYAIKIAQEKYLDEVLTPEWAGGIFHRRSNLWSDNNLIIS